MQLVVGAAVGAGVGAVVGAAATWKLGGESPAGGRREEKAAPCTLIPKPTKKLMMDVLLTAKVAPDASKQCVIDAVQRLFCLLAEVQRPNWQPDVLVQKDALLFKRDAKFAIEELLDTCVTQTSTPLYIEELNKQKAALMAHIETTGSQIIQVSRQRITQNALKGGGASS